MTLLRFGFGTMEADNFDDGDENEHIVPDYNNDKKISTDELQEYFDENDDDRCHVYFRSW